MDVGELLSFKPEQTPKRRLDDDDDIEPQPTKKALKESKNEVRSKRIADAKALLPSNTTQITAEIPLTEEEKASIMKYVENEDAEGEVLDENGLKKIILLFEKRNLKNQEMRMKFPDNPEKFMESELDLHEAIEELKIVSTVPDLYYILVDIHAISSLLELLSHPNTDISVAVVSLIHELTDADILYESDEGTEIIVQSLRDQQITALLVQNLERLNENIKEESEGIYNSLAIIENLMEMAPEVVREAAEQGILAWILKKIKQKAPFDLNKSYCGELLSILLQTDNDNRLMLGNLDGIDVLLQQLAVYKRHDPHNVEEQEYMENIFNSLCSALMVKENRERFLKGEGLQLMNLMLREKKMSRNGSLKVLDHAVTGPDGKDNCNKFVDILGLRTIFPLFMKTPKRNKKRLLSIDEHEEHVVSIIASMLRNCKGVQRQRLLSKFSENDYEKVDRLLELHIKYLEKVDAVEKELEATPEEPIDEDERADKLYIQKLSRGLFTLQLIDYIILEISAVIDTVKQRVLKILNLRGASMKTIRNLMREYAGNLGDAGDMDWRDQEQAHIISLVDRF